MCIFLVSTQPLHAICDVLILQVVHVLKHSSDCKSVPPPTVHIKMRWVEAPTFCTTSQGPGLLEAFKGVLRGVRSGIIPVLHTSRNSLLSCRTHTVCCEFQQIIP